MLKAIVYNPVTGQIVDGVDVPGIKQVPNTKEPPQSYLDQLAASFQVCHAQHGSQTRQQPLQQPLRRSPRVVQSAQTNTTTGGPSTTSQQPKQQPSKRKRPHDSNGNTDAKNKQEIRNTERITN